MTVKIIIGDCLTELRRLESESVHCIVTSPPYWGLRSYCADNSPEKAFELGLERSLGEHLGAMVAVFEECRRVLRKDGTCWINYGDCYATSPNGRSAADTKAAGNDDRTFRDKPFSTVGPIYVPDAEKGDRRGGACKQRTHDTGLTAHTGRIVSGGTIKPKDLCMVPNRLAIALQEPRYLGRIKRLEDRVWLAAMVDGEGCMFIHKRKIGQNNGQGYSRKSDSYSTGLEVANTSLAIVERCLEITGLGSICSQDKGRRRTLFRWNLRSSQCREVIREIYPHLVAKQHEARLLLGCPSSGRDAERAHVGVIALHNGAPTDIDFPAPESMYGPGWYVRSEIVWLKPNPMPESITDRPATSHEKIWMLSKSARYFYDAEAVREPMAETSIPRLAQDIDAQAGSNRAHGGKKIMKAVGGQRKDKQRGHGRRHDGFNDRWDDMSKEEQQANGRNCRNVWSIATKPFSEAHFATFPPELAERCIKAGCPQDGTVLDPFGGAGTTGLVADRLQRNAILIELNPEYAAMAERRIKADAGMFGEIKAERAA